MSNFRITDNSGRVIFSEQREGSIERLGGLDEEVPDYRKSALTHEFVKLMTNLENRKLTEVPTLEKEDD